MNKSKDSYATDIEWLDARISELENHFFNPPCDTEKFEKLPEITLEQKIESALTSNEDIPGTFLAWEGDVPEELISPVKIPPGFRACTYDEALTNTGNEEDWRLGMCTGCDEHEPGELEFFSEAEAEDNIKITWLCPIQISPSVIPLRAIPIEDSVITKGDCQEIGKPSTMQGDCEPCYYCKELCNAWAGNPSHWPIPLTHSDEPGVVKWHHIGCVSKRLQIVEPDVAELTAKALELCKEFYYDYYTEEEASEVTCLIGEAWKIGKALVDTKK